MAQIFENINYVWLIAGGILIVFEFILLPGVGFLFAGLGALTVGGLSEGHVIEGQLAQWLVFFAATLVWTLILWKPLKNFRIHHHAPFSDMVGKKAILLTSLAPGGKGQAKWSGTIMNARLDPNIKETFPEGAEVTIGHVEGNVLVVK